MIFDWDDVVAFYGLGMDWSGVSGTTAAPTAFVALLPYLDVKLQQGIITIHFPKITTTAQVNIATSSRVTRAGNIRATRAGNVRATSYTITSYPEVIAVKLPSSIISIPVHR